MGEIRARRSPRLKMTVFVVWLITTLSLAGWWLVFGLQQIDRISQINNESAREIARRHRMLMSEGAFLFALLLGGGIALLYFMLVEIRHSRQIRVFFAAFTHDLKTSLASLRLQAEALEEDLKDHPEHARVARRLVKDRVRLEVQLENSLFLADTEMGHLHIEDVPIDTVIGNLRHYWPELDLRLDQRAEHGCVVRADVRALESILKNVLQNAVVHGKASKIELRCEPFDGRNVRIELQDNGRGFSGDPSRLGQMFVRHTTTSGSGIGLYLVRELVHRMGGEITFLNGSGPSGERQGFRVQLDLPGRVA